MFNHIMIGTNDIDKSKAFYEKVLKVIGVEGAMDNTLDSGIKRVFFMHDGDVLALSQPIDGEVATCANGMTIGFKCDSPEQVKELHDAAIAAGGTSIEKLVLPQALGNAAATWYFWPLGVVTPKISMCSANQPSSRPMLEAMRSAKHFLPSSALPP